MCLEKKITKTFTTSCVRHIKKKSYKMALTSYRYLWHCKCFLKWLWSPWREDKSRVIPPPVLILLSELHLLLMASKRHPLRPQPGWGLGLSLVKVSQIRGFKDTALFSVKSGYVVG